MSAKHEREFKIIEKMIKIWLLKKFLEPFLFESEVNELWSSFIS